MLPFSVITLHFQSDFSHAFRSATRLDFICLFALRGGFGASFLVEFLLATLALLFETFEDVDGAAFREIAWCGDTSCVRVFVVFGTHDVWHSQSEATSAREGSCMGELRTTGEHMRHADIRAGRVRRCAARVWWRCESHPRSQWRPLAVELPEQQRWCTTRQVSVRSSGSWRVASSWRICRLPLQSWYWRPMASRRWRRPGRALSL